MRYPVNAVVLGPIALRQTAIDAVALMGHTISPNVRLSADGNEPATHVGLSSPVTQDFADVLTGDIDPGVPGLSDLLAALAIDLEPRPIDQLTHFLSVLAEAGLQRIIPDE